MLSSRTLLPLLCLSSLLLTSLIYVVAEEPNFSNKIGQGYRLISIKNAPDGTLLGLLQVKQKNTIYGPDIPLLRLYVK